jgi:ribosome-associated protein
MARADHNTKDDSDRDSTDGLLRIAPGVWIERGDLHFAFSRSSGPGGQAVNKVSTRAQLRVALGAIRGLPEDGAARLRHLAGRRLTADNELVIAAETFRSQQDNKRACIERLRSLIAAALVRPKVRKKKRPTRSMIEKRLKGKRLHSEKKQVRRDRRVRGEE